MNTRSIWLPWWLMIVLLLLLSLFLSPLAAVVLGKDISLNGTRCVEAAIHCAALHCAHHKEQQSASAQQVDAAQSEQPQPQLQPCPLTTQLKPCNSAQPINLQHPLPQQQHYMHTQQPTGVSGARLQQCPAMAVAAAQLQAAGACTTLRTTHSAPVDIQRRPRHDMQHVSAASLPNMLAQDTAADADLSASSPSAAAAVTRCSAESIPRINHVTQLRRLALPLKHCWGAVAAALRC